MKKNLKIIILSIIVLATMTFEVIGMSTSFGSFYSYVVKPLIWIFIGIITYFFFKGDVIPNLKHKKEVSFCVIVTTLIYFAIYFCMGYVKGFAHNPYDYTLKGIINNLWIFVPIVIVKEYVRYYMINNSSQKRILLNALLISILFTLIDLNIYKFGSYFSSSLNAFEFVIQTLIPSLITNLYLTYISYYASYKAALIYTFIPQFLMYVLPILPDLDLATISLLNSIIPFFSYIYINYLINKLDKTLDRRDNKTVGIKGWILMILFIIFMILFGLGVFNVKPLVIASNSMLPKIRKGDIVIIKDIDVNKIKKGDVIRYKMDGYYVVHRVVLIRTDEKGKREFITKGDNNNDVDLFSVKEYQVDGIVKLDIPYLGYPTLIFSKILHTDVDKKVTIDKGRINWLSKNDKYWFILKMFYEYHWTLFY